MSAVNTILAVGRIIEGEVHWTISPLPFDVCHFEGTFDGSSPCGKASKPVEEAPQDGELQSSIDYGAELQELEDDMADREFWSKGQW